ncbi:MAG: hypothetical protein U0Y68_14520 [Blastocatellia bacterium]
MRNLRGGIGRVCLVALWLWTGLVSAHSQTGKACTENAAFYEHEYTVNDVRIDLPLGWLLSAIGQQRELLLASPDMPIKKDDPYREANANAGFELVRERLPALQALPPFRFAFRFGHPQLQNCDPQTKKLDVVYRIYSFAPANYVSQTLESGRQEEVHRTTPETPGTQRLADYFLQPAVTYNRASGLVGGTKLTIKQPGGLLEQLKIAAAGSTSASFLHVDATGARDFKRGLVRHTEWHFAYVHTDVPGGATRLRQGTLSGQFSAATRSFGPQEALLFRFGGAVEGGTKQTDLDPRRIPALELARSGYGAVKGFAGALLNLEHHTFKASYGVQVSKAGEGFQVDYVKQLFDTAAALRFRLQEHRALTVDSQFTVGHIHTLGKIPVAERFFGGNAEQNFLTGEDWVIRSAPVLRSFAQNRFVPVGANAKLGGDRFLALNVTAAVPVWGYPLVPSEVLKDREFKGSLETGLSVAKGALRNRILGDTPQFKEIATLALALPPVVTQLKNELLTLANANPNAQIDAVLKRLFKPSTDPKIKPSGAFDRVERYVGIIAHSLDPQADEAPATEDIVTLAVGDKSDPDDPLPSYIEDLSELLVRLEGLVPADTASRIKRLREQLDDKGKQITEKYMALEASPLASQANIEAQKGMVRSTRVLNQFLYEANLIAVSPVLTFDIARIGRQSFQGNAPRYSLGTGLRISLVSLDITAGYAWNLHRRPGEGRGALLFKMEVTNLFR